MFWIMKIMNCYILFDIIFKDQSSTSVLSVMFSQFVVFKFQLFIILFLIKGCGHSQTR